MRDLRLILAEAEGLIQAGRPGVLATVVRASGSVYRGAGARVLVDGGGTVLGALSGGCLERDLSEEAVELCGRGGGKLLRYDATADSDVLWGLGLGCKGAVEIWLETLGSGTRPVLWALERCLRRRQEAVLVTVFEPASLSATALALAEGEVEFAGGDGALRPLLQAAAETARDEMRAGGGGVDQRELPTANGPVRILVECMRPPVHLVVCGGGYDAQALVRLGLGLGWQVSVVDPRPGLARPERFPGAEVVQAHPERTAERLDWRGPVAVQLMTHNYLRDLALLEAVHGLGQGQKPLAYLGVLGPRQRTRRLLDELAERGTAFSQPLWGPAGLDIGAESPEEIALSIVAQIKAVGSGRGGGALGGGPAA